MESVDDTEVHSGDGNPVVGIQYSKLYMIRNTILLPEMPPDAHSLRSL